MVATSLLAMMLVMVFQMLRGIQTTWKRTRQTVGEFRDSRQGFDEITRRIGGATLNTYWGYKSQKSASGRSAGQAFIPQSELHFVCGPVKELGIQEPKSAQVGARYTHGIFFQAPFGFTVAKDEVEKNELKFDQLNSTLNAWGYYIEFNTDELDRPEFLTSIENAPLPRPRYRLMEFRQPTEYLQIYKLNLRRLEKVDKNVLYQWFNTGLYSVNSEWNTTLIGRNEPGFFRTTRTLSENIIAMILRPREADERALGGGGAAGQEDKKFLAPNFLFDSRNFQYATSAEGAASRHQLPPIIDITFIAIDEPGFGVYCTKNDIKTAAEDPALMDPAWFQVAKDFSSDLRAVEEKLKGLGLQDYRIFNTSIRMRESKWVDDTDLNAAANGDAAGGGK